MFFPDALDHCSGRIEADDFYDAKHQAIWRSIEDVVELGRDVTPPEVEEAHRRRYGEKPDVMTMVDCTSLAVSGATIKGLVSTLEDRSARRAMLSIGQHIGSAFADPRIDPDDLREQIETDLMERGLDDEHAEPSTIADMLTDTFGEIEDARARGGLLQGWSTGLGDWDGLLAEGGFVTGQHVLAAGTSQGKTALALKTSLTIAKNGGCVVFFAMEMTKRSLMFRLLSLDSGVESWKMKRGRLTPDEWKTVAQSAGRLAKLNFHAIDKSGMTVAGARSQLRRIKRASGLDFVVIDYLQLMEGQRADTREQEVAKISRGLKGLSKDLDVPFLTLSQLSRSHEHRTGMDKEPRLSDLRESGSIEQDADSVSFIFMPHRYGLTAEDGSSLEAVAKILVRKQRDGALGEFWVTWDGETTTFADSYAGPRIEPKDDDIQGALI